MKVLPALTVYRCVACQTLTQRLPKVCAHCLQQDFSPESVANSGHLASWTTIRKPPLRFGNEGPYHVGVFDLDMGMRVSGRLLLEPTDQVGDRVQAVTPSDAAPDVPVFKVISDG